MNQETASTLALKALAWLVNDEDLVGVFMGATGATVQDLRAQASDPAFQVSILEFLTMDDRWVMQFCDSVGEDYAAPLMASQVLAGEAGRHWT